jgi:hypothetical protein
MAALFFADVSAARGLTGDALAKVTTGDAWLSADALTYGLIDGIASLDAVLADFIATTSSPRRPAAVGSKPFAGAGPAATGNQTMKIAPDRMAALIKDHQHHAVLISSMAAGTADAQPATEAEIIAAIEREDGKAIKAKVDALTAELAASNAAHATQIAGKDAEIADLKTKLELAQKPKGVEPLAGGAAPQPPKPDAIAAYRAKEAELIKAGDKTPANTIARLHPTINQAFIEAVNAKTPKKEA